MFLNTSSFEEKINIKFSNEKLLREALTHRSYLNENPNWSVPHNERLEYLGDAVLELIVTEYLFTTYPNYQEGELTSIRAALVNYQMMAKVARELSLDDFLFLSRGESKDSGKAREVILANAMESVIGAIYLDGGYDVAKDFINRVLIPHAEKIVSERLYRDPKSILQEIVQEKLKTTPVYRVLKEEGPDHQKEFIVGVFFGESMEGEGVGTSKQEAESNAARNALNKFENE